MLEERPSCDNDNSALGPATDASDVNFLEATRTRHGTITRCSFPGEDVFRLLIRAQKRERLDTSGDTRANVVSTQHGVAAESVPHLIARRRRNLLAAPIPETGTAADRALPTTTEEGPLLSAEAC
ncbi:hypothetical protein PsYK624_089170 [Phanerochaete sordida]|uniref:Uncharacterized protein n=1 Tax=Phanerochaete sordida TaxID=48140 RepID=A0A9P3GDG5_9APHY|nr:hypothetical protein PsYK624_089170 [Phanerochaete sordida]